LGTVPFFLFFFVSKPIKLEGISAFAFVFFFFFQHPSGPPPFLGWRVFPPPQIHLRIKAIGNTNNGGKFPFLPAVFGLGFESQFVQTGSGTRCNPCSSEPQKKQWGGLRTAGKSSFHQPCHVASKSFPFYMSNVGLKGTPPPTFLKITHYFFPPPTF